MDTVQVTAGSEATLVELGTGMEIAMLQALHQQLSPALTRTTALVLDAGQLLRIDTASLQLLACLCRSARERAIQIQWRAVNPVMRQAAQQSGLDHLLLGQP